MKRLLTMLLAVACALPVQATDAEDEAQAEAYKQKSMAASPGEMMKLINSGWTENYDHVKRHLRPGKSYVVLHVWDPGSVMDLRSADGFRATLHSIGLLNAGDVKIGHTWVSWRCQTPNGLLEGAAGVTGENSTQTADMLKGGFGLSAFKSIFTDGYMQWPELLEWNADGEPGNLHTVFLQVSDSVCQRTAGFVDTYVRHPNQPRKNFGLEPNPAKFQGAGCGSFGIVAAEQGGVFGASGLSAHFWRRIRAQSRLFGTGATVPVATRAYPAANKSSVPLLNPIGGDVLTTVWTGTEESDPRLRIMDPELMILAVREIYRLKFQELYRSNGRLARQFLTLKNPGYAYRVFASHDIGESVAMRAYRTERGQNPDELVFDGRMDEQAGRVVRATREWLREGHFRARFTKVGKRTAIILDRRDADSF